MVKEQARTKAVPAMKELIGKTLEDATREIAGMGGNWRIYSNEGLSVGLTMDYDDMRYNLKIVGGIVVDYHKG